MIETTTREYLAGLLSVPVYVASPARTEGSYVTIEKTENTRYCYVEETVLSIVSWADSPYEAALLNDEVKKHMLLIADNEKTVSSCELNSDYYFSDTTLKKYGYQALFAVCHV